MKPNLMQPICSEGRRLSGLGPIVSGGYTKANIQVGGSSAGRQ